MGTDGEEVTEQRFIGETGASQPTSFVNNIPNLHLKTQTQSSRTQEDLDVEYFEEEKGYFKKQNVDSFKNEMNDDQEEAKTPCEIKTSERNPLLFTSPSPTNVVTTSTLESNALQSMVTKVAPIPVSDDN